MRLSYWIIFGLLLLSIIAAASAIYTDYGTNKVNLVIKTNGTDTYITNESKLSGPKSQEMMQDIKQNVITDVASSNSTDESIKSDVRNIASKYDYNANVKIVSQFGIDELPLFVTVNGTSMVPTLKNGQELIVLKTNNLNVGDIVVAIHPTYGLIVKRISMIEVNQVYLTSDNKKVEIINKKTTLPNGTVKTIKEQKSSLNTWLPRNNVIGVVMLN
ncbi:MAG: S24/S26 family peptidase [Methanobacterium sp.]|uniref:S24/S26 family peptidase n=1 Tax=Methanobacterium sp. TaxID=2164 RepID=UPI003C763CC4